MSAPGGGSDPVHLVPLPDQLRRLEAPPSAEVLALVDAEHARWRGLHDRLIAMIATLLDVATDAGRPVREVIEDVVTGTNVPLDSLVGVRIDPAEIAGLLRAHGSTGSVREEAGTTVFRHQCGTGLRYWRANPDTPTVVEGEVPGVPAGSPRYCARCISTIHGHGGPQWQVTPPTDPTQCCTWTVRPA